MGYGLMLGLLNLVLQQMSKAMLDRSNLTPPNLQSKAYGQVRAHPPVVPNFKGLGTDIIQAVLGVELQGTATWSFGTVS
jgi:hypothetical protein